MRMTAVVEFEVDVPEDAKNKNICFDIPLEKVKVLDGAALIKDSEVIGYQTQDIVFDEEPVEDED